MKIDGECYCGEIAFEAELNPDHVGLCHCTDCQKLSGSAFRMTARVQGSTFNLLRGEPTRYVKIGDSGNRRIQHFCGKCGSDLYAHDDTDSPERINVRTGTVRQRAQLKPKFEGWYGSALPWLPHLEHTDKTDGNQV